MTPNDATIAAAAIVMVSGLTDAVLVWAFRLPPAPAWARVWAKAALGLVGAREMARRLNDLDPSWWGAAVWVNLAAASVALVAGAWTGSRVSLTGEALARSAEADARTEARSAEADARTEARSAEAEARTEARSAEADARTEARSAEADARMERRE